ncbi:MAG: RcsF protein [Moritella sp.]|jgi:RcsF protein
MKCLLLICVVLTGCSHYPIHTNLDKENFTDYFSISNVTYYQTKDLQKYHVEQLGFVEGESCQQMLNQPPAEQEQAMIAAKRQAATLGANGIIIRSCITPPPSKACHSSYVCYADAIIATSLLSDEEINAGSN